MKPILNQAEAIYYISTSDMIKFIEANSNMEWNNICDFVRKEGIASEESDRTYWVKDDLLRYSKEYNEEQKKWIGAFFEAHLWIERMMIVFDD